MAKTKKLQLIHQGDVLFVPVKRAPEGKEIAPEVMEGGAKRVMVKAGEARDHFHAIYDASAVNFIVNEETQKQYLKVNKSTVLQHEEHRQLCLTIGDFDLEVRTPVEYVPNALPRAVVD